MHSFHWQYSSTHVTVNSRSVKNRHPPNIIRITFRAVSWCFGAMLKCISRFRIVSFWLAMCFFASCIYARILSRFGFRCNVINVSKHKNLRNNPAHIFARWQLKAYTISQANEMPCGKRRKSVYPDDFNWMRRHFFLHKLELSIL